MQDTPLFSADTRVFLIVQANGDLVLYNRQAYALYGATASAAIWASHTEGAVPQPFALAMQPVRGTRMPLSVPLSSWPRCAPSQHATCMPVPSLPPAL